VRRALLVTGIVVAVAAAVAAINRVVDPKDEFYSGAPLTAALDANCLLADDVVHARSYPEFKQDLFRRRHTTTLTLGSNVELRRGVNMGFPGFGPAALLDAMRFLARATPRGNRLTAYVITDGSWFDSQVHRPTFRESFVSKVGYLLSPWTLKSSLDLMRRSRTLAFSGWQKEGVGRSCIVHRGSPYPAWRADGTLTGAPKSGSATGRTFAWSRLSPLDAALGIAHVNGWRVVGLSEPTPQWETYQRELSALFSKYGYRWRVRRMQA
jgi:hypothetical protein